jgi:hypothetical protein
LVAFTAPAKPSAITANSSIALIFFIGYLLFEIERVIVGRQLCHRRINEILNAKVIPKFEADAFRGGCLAQCVGWAEQFRSQPKNRYL